MVKAGTYDRIVDGCVVVRDLMLWPVGISYQVSTLETSADLVVLMITTKLRYGVVVWYLHIHLSEARDGSLIPGFPVFSFETAVATYELMHGMFQGCATMTGHVYDFKGSGLEFDRCFRPRDPVIKVTVYEHSLDYDGKIVSFDTEKTTDIVAIGHTYYVFEVSLTDKPHFDVRVGDGGYSYVVAYSLVQSVQCLDNILQPAFVGVDYLVECDYNDFNLVASFFKDTFKQNFSDLTFVMTRLIDAGYKYFNFIGDGYGVGQLVLKTLGLPCVAFSSDPSFAMRVLARQLGLDVQDFSLPYSEFFVEVYFHVDAPLPSHGMYVYYSKRRFDVGVTSYGNLYVGKAIKASFWGTPLLFDSYVRPFVPSSSGQLIFCNDDKARYLADCIFKSDVVSDFVSASTFYFSASFDVVVASLHDITFYYVQGDKRFLVYTYQCLDLIGRLIGFNAQHVYYFASVKSFLHDEFIMTCIINGHKVFFLSSSC